LASSKDSPRLVFTSAGEGIVWIGRSLDRTEKAVSISGAHGDHGGACACAIAEWRPASGMGRGAGVADARLPRPDRRPVPSAARRQPARALRPSRLSSASPHRARSPYALDTPSTCRGPEERPARSTATNQRAACDRRHAFIFCLRSGASPSAILTHGPMTCQRVRALTDCIRQRDAATERGFGTCRKTPPRDCTRPS